tara:strand:- start:139 stop:336 length:198 start_codon:yes stop_codon:yes gene_type:complete
MNKIESPEFFEFWEWEKWLHSLETESLSPKAKLEYEMLENAFFEKTGYSPSYDYQTAAWNYKNTR